MDSSFGGSNIRRSAAGLLRTSVKGGFGLAPRSTVPSQNLTSNGRCPVSPKSAVNTARQRDAAESSYRTADGWNSTWAVDILWSYRNRQSIPGFSMQTSCKGRQIGVQGEASA